jgi:hypothetical protein
MRSPPAIFALRVPMKRRDPLRLARVIETDAQLAAWNLRRVREEKLLTALRRALPRPVAERVFVADADGSSLELSTSAGAIATIVRQQGPQLLAALARDGWQFSGMRIRVQPGNMPLSSIKALPRQWDNASRRPLVALHERLGDGPLKAALQRLLKGR